MIGDARAVEPLIKALRNKRWTVRRDVLQALGEIGDERAAKPLTKALKDENKEVREAAEEAWKKIEGGKSGK